MHLASSIRGDGHEAVTVSVRAPVESIERALGGAGAAIIVGGDGSVHHALPLLVRTGVPLWHAPLGTENLVARELRHSRRSEPIRRALAAARVKSIDIAECNGRAFLVMVSVGPDAGVIHRMARGRTGPITRLSYAWPITREVFAPSIGPLTIEVDGRQVVNADIGIAVVANSRQYATRIDPAFGARIDDGMLDVAFMPASNVLVALYRLTRARFRDHGPEVVTAKGTSVRIIRGPVQAQIDGEAMHSPDDPLEFRVRPGILRVLQPADE